MSGRFKFQRLLKVFKKEETLEIEEQHLNDTMVMEEREC